MGAAAAGVSAVAYAASGNKGKALEMGVTAAAQLVGAGAGVRAGFKVASVAAKAGSRSRAANKAARACGNSFAAGTLVRLSDGSLAPIETLETGDLVLAGDPVSGDVTVEQVIYPITGTGTKHLIDITIEGTGTPITATGNHPFWVDGKGWIDAVELTPGDRLVGSSGGITVVRAMHDRGWLSGQTVHNVHISGPHTYFVASNTLDDQLVHNAACSLALHRVPRERCLSHHNEGRQRVHWSGEEHAQANPRPLQKAWIAHREGIHCPEYRISSHAQYWQRVRDGCG
nr:polymorphic toxin-type HINT domain-containing protein [Cellulosimicrobium sp. 72-3]